MSRIALRESLRQVLEQSPIQSHRKESSGNSRLIFDRTVALQAGDDFEVGTGRDLRRRTGDCLDIRALGLPPGRGRGKAGGTDSTRNAAQFVPRQTGPIPSGVASRSRRMIRPGQHGKAHLPPAAQQALSPRETPLRNRSLPHGVPAERMLRIPMTSKGEHQLPSETCAASAITNLTAGWSSSNFNACGSRLRTTHEPPLFSTI